jgi:CheY-like chemotaxis protein
MVGSPSVLSRAGVYWGGGQAAGKEVSASRTLPQAQRENPLPGSNIAVRVLAIKGSTVRLGIEAPPEVAILREELSTRAGPQEPPMTLPPDGAGGPTLHQITHLLRDWLDVASIGLALRCRQRQAGLPEAPLGQFDLGGQVDREIGTLREHLRGMGRQPLPRSRVLLAEHDQTGREFWPACSAWRGSTWSSAAAPKPSATCARGQPDVVLLEMGLPSSESPAVVRTIRREQGRGELRVFAVTRHAPEGFGLTTGRGGIDHWFNASRNSEAMLQDLEEELAGMN